MVTKEPIRYVGSPDFHDGFVREISDSGAEFVVVVEGQSGRRYRVCFHEPQSIHQVSPIGMMLYGITETPTEVEGDQRYTFLNWDGDESDDPNAPCLDLTAHGFEVEPLP